MATVAQDTINFVENNKDYYDKIAHEFDQQPHALERARRTAIKLREAFDFKEDTTTVLEYACGTGLVSRELAPYTKRIVGVDISQGVVDQFNSRVHNQGIPSEEMQAFRAELKGEAGELGDEKFDVVILGGVLLVVDLASTGGHAHHDHQLIPDHVHHIVPHRGGLSESDMHKAFESAGLDSFSFDDSLVAKHDARLFLAKGIKSLD
ncbi:hypothetical protein C0995_013351 [Termitomyces sp. Mi166|nr:hypothetical protein C0995_013351 [Termitomyces sp. Mi166\